MRSLVNAAEKMFGVDLASGYATAANKLSEIDIKDVILAALSGADNPVVCARSERNPMLIKLCLAYDKERDIDIRLNYYYRSQYFHDSWHDHKWNFFSRILIGQVTHLVSVTQTGDIDNSVAMTHRSGDIFCIGNRMFHSFLPVPGTVTLMLRGPSLRASWNRVDIEPGNAKLRSSDELAAQRLALDADEYRTTAEAIVRCLTLTDQC